MRRERQHYPASRGSRIGGKEEEELPQGKGIGPSESSCHEGGGKEGENIFARTEKNGKGR